MSKRVESKREKAFRLSIVKTIPRFPNNKETLSSLEQMSLGQLLIYYTNWAIRFVAPRARKVVIEPTACNDPRWSLFKPQIDAFLDKVTSGSDLNPHLSMDPKNRGYTPSTSARDLWADKDFLLNVMGYHHFHLGITIAPSGFVTRTDELIFAKVTRDTLCVVAMSNHSVFTVHPSPSETMTQERERLWRIFDEYSSRGLPKGTCYFPAMITTSGHSWHLVHLAGEYARIVHTLDPKLDDISYVQRLYNGSGIRWSPKAKLKWHLNFMDIGLADECMKVFFVLKYGPG